MSDLHAPLELLEILHSIQRESGYDGTGKVYDAAAAPVAFQMSYGSTSNGTPSDYSPFTTPNVVVHQYDSRKSVPFVGIF